MSKIEMAMIGEIRELKEKVDILLKNKRKNRGFVKKKLPVKIREKLNEDRWGMFHNL